MIAYNNTHLHNLRLSRILRSDLKSGKITTEEFKVISEKFPVGFYTPGIWARVGLFILTFVIILFSDGLLSLLFSSSGWVPSGGWFIFLGLCSSAALELIVAGKNHYHSGVDDALIFFSALQINMGFAFLFYA